MFRFPVSVAVVLTLLAAPTLTFADDPSDLIQQGVELHEDDKYEEAIARFREALKIDPDNVKALYEMANSYAASEQYPRCVATAEKGLQQPSDLEASLYSILGSCYSSWEKTHKALKAFRTGLKQHPNSVPLNYNIAVTLAAEDQGHAAIEHLKTAIANDPTYPSAYLLLGQVYAAHGYTVPAMYALMRFVTLEPNSARTYSAASQVFRLHHLGVEEGSSPQEINLGVDVDAPKDEGDFGALEIGRATTAASQYLEAGQSISKADAAVEALEQFLQICVELDDEDLQDTFTWQHLAPLLLDLQRDGTFKAFAYVLALRAGFDGAVEWLESHPKEFRAMNSSL